MKEEMNLSDLWGGCIWSRGKQQTNADRIRQMSDEELAKWFCVMNADDCPDKAHELHCTDKCYECWLDWLKSPVEEGEG